MSDIVQFSNDLLVPFGKNLVAFFEKPIVIQGVEKPRLYIYIKNNEDLYTVYQQPAKKVLYRNPDGSSMMVEQTKLYKKAYDIFLAKKNIFSRTRGGKSIKSLDSE